jgi:hypothetical protein
MAVFHAVKTSRSAHRTVANGEHHGIPLRQRYDAGAGLPRPLFGEHEFSPGEITAGAR